MGDFGTLESIRLSVAILTHNETDTLAELLAFILSYPRNDVEIRLLDDYSDALTLEIIRRFQQASPRVHLYQCHLNKNFAIQRNYLHIQCAGEFIFCVDADELPPRYFMDNMDQILEMLDREGFDACAFPRINLMGAVRSEVIKRHKLAINELGWVNFPGMQLKLFRNQPGIKYVYSVHEHLVGYRNLCRFPPEEPDAVIHRKPEAMFLHSIAFYNTFRWRYLEKCRNP